MDTDKLMEHWNEYIAELRQQCMDEGGFDLDFFLQHALEEHPKYCWRSTKSLCIDSSASLQDIQRALDRLVAKGIVVQNSMNEEHFGLRSRIEKELGSHRIQYETTEYKPFFPDSYSTEFIRDGRKGTLCPDRDDAYNPEPCPQSIKAAIDAGLLAKPKVVMIDPVTFLPIQHEVRSLTKDDMFQETTKCLQEIHKIIARAEILNTQISSIVSQVQKPGGVS